ncbi:unnamed protein product [Candidula unifasciata]|uniref:40S ribosomal protein S25 n=1 Tax=Candidula unifasciata TaxID=100452 RepID=A0A8S3YSW1_9EUPU|nr:unnamed protein product [Candidula unifasciata]
MGAKKTADAKSAKAAKPVVGKPKKEGSGGKNKKKWSKGKVRDKLNNLILFDTATYDKLYKEVPSYKLITPSVVSERLIHLVSKHNSQLIYTRAQRETRTKHQQKNSNVNKQKKLRQQNFF